MQALGQFMVTASVVCVYILKTVSVTTSQVCLEETTFTIFFPKEKLYFFQSKDFNQIVN